MTSRVSSVIAAAMLVITAAEADAQEYALDRGSLQIAGSASFTSRDTDSGTDDGRATVITVSPSLHYFVVERLAIGADLTFGYVTTPADISTRSIGIGPSVSYYFTGPQSSVHPYVSARASFARFDFDSPGGETDSSRRTGTAAAGILAMLGRSVGITTELFYQLERTESGEQEGSGNMFGLSAGVAAFVF